MAQLLIRNLDDRIVGAYKARALLRGMSLEHNAPFAPEERATLARHYVAEFPEQVPTLSKEEMREGLL